jgi:hypothetical protein
MFDTFYEKKIGMKICTPLSLSLKLKNDGMDMMQLDIIKMLNFFQGKKNLLIIDNYEISYYFRDFNYVYTCVDDTNIYESCIITKTLNNINNLEIISSKDIENITHEINLVYINGKFFNRIKDYLPKWKYPDLYITCEQDLYEYLGYSNILDNIYSSSIFDSYPKTIPDFYKKAFFLYKQEKYLEAYNILKQILSVVKFEIYKNNTILLLCNCCFYLNYFDECLNLCNILITFEFEVEKVMEILKYIIKIPKVLKECEFEIKFIEDIDISQCDEYEDFKFISIFKTHENIITDGNIFVNEKNYITYLNKNFEIETKIDYNGLISNFETIEILNDNLISFKSKNGYELYDYSDFEDIKIQKLNSLSRLNFFENNEKIYYMNDKFEIFDFKTQKIIMKINTKYISYTNILNYNEMYFIFIIKTGLNIYSVIKIKKDMSGYIISDKIYFVGNINKIFKCDSNLGIIEFNIFKTNIYEISLN